MLDTSVPNLARAYDYLLGGGANFAADRALAGRLTDLYPATAELLSISRTLRANSVSAVAAAGIEQYVDVGSGLPTRPSTHAVALRARPGARVVYVDSDPAVTSHLTSLLPPRVQGSVRAVDGDLAEPEALLRSMAPFIDFTKPVCLALTMILQVLDPGAARAVTAVLIRALAPGSHLLITVGAGEEGRLPDAVSPGGFTTEDVAGFFTGLELLPPGIHEGPVLGGTGMKRA